MNQNSSANSSNANPDKDDPGIQSVYDFITFGVSLPERALRSTTAVVGGVLRESSQLLVPQAFQSSRSYSTFVTQMLDFMAEDIGGVKEQKKAGEKEDPEVQGYVARKTVGSLMDLAGMATLHLSPLTILAIVSDVAYGSKEYLEELSNELKEQGIIAKDSTIDSAASLLDAVSNASGTTAEAFNTPPLSVDGLKNTINDTTDAVTKIDPASIIPQSEIRRMWDSMKQAAKKDNVSLFDISSAMTMFTVNRIGDVGAGSLATVKVAGNLFDRHIIDHYRTGITEIQEKGVYHSIANSSKPYLSAVWNNFSTQKSTITEDLLSGKIVGNLWTTLSGWMSPKEEKENTPKEKP